jgi:hypothetical protein
MTARLNRRGATLPLSILIIGLLGTAVAITFARLSSERRTTGDAKAEIDAYTVAQSGLSRYFSTLTNGVKPSNNGNVTYNDLPNGTARVDWRLIRDETPGPPILPAIWVVTSRGTNTAAKRYGPTTPAAQRSVATYAVWTPAPFDLNAALTTLTTVNKNGASGEMSGIDACGVMPSIPGVANPDGAAGYTGPTGPIDGNPDNTPVNLGTGGPAGTARNQVGIDWAGIVQGPQSPVLPHDFLYPAWPTAAQMNNWPVVRVNGDLSLPSDGKGILIVTGNMTLSGSSNWDGLILVGGTLTSNGNNHTKGAVIAGLNVKLGQVVGQSQLNGNKTYEYDSCALTHALGHVGSLQRVRNGWTDTWPSY